MARTWSCQVTSQTILVKQRDGSRAAKNDAQEPSPRFTSKESVFVRAIAGLC